MKDKKKTIIIALAAFCLVAAIACAVGAAVVKKASGGTDATSLTFSTLPDGTKISEIKDDYAKVKSASVKGAPDTFVKAAYIKKVDSNIKQFNLIKTYDAFRIYDAVSADGGKIITVCANSDKAVIAFSGTYKTNAERANYITRAIEKLDKNYELLLKQANMDNVKKEDTLY